MSKSLIGRGKHHVTAETETGVLKLPTKECRGSTAIIRTRTRHGRFLPRVSDGARPH